MILMTMYNSSDGYLRILFHRHRVIELLYRPERQVVSYTTAKQQNDSPGHPDQQDRVTGMAR